MPRPDVVKGERAIFLIFLLCLVRAWVEKYRQE
jgi:hypothetical protein